MRRHPDGDPTRGVRRGRCAAATDVRDGPNPHAERPGPQSSIPGVRRAIERTSPESDASRWRCTDASVSSDRVVAALLLVVLTASIAVVSYDRGRSSQPAATVRADASVVETLSSAMIGLDGAARAGLTFASSPDRAALTITLGR
jgi:hypothetical protein